MQQAPRAMKIKDSSVDISCRHKKHKKPFGIFSFFTGAGFLDLGFEDSGFVPFMANEIDDNFARVYLYSHERMKRALPKFGLEAGDICGYQDVATKKDKLTLQIKQARAESSLIGFIGGPPCPDFSVAGKQAGAGGKHGRLSQVYVDMICTFAPDFFVFENVKGLWKTAKHRAFFDSIVNQLKKAGYGVTYKLINALEYGAAQDRERIILFGTKASRCKPRFVDTTGEIKNFPWSAFTKYNIDEIHAVNWPTTTPFSEDSRLEAPKGIPVELTVQYWFDRNDVEHHPNAGNFFIPRAGLKKMQTFAEGDDSRKCYKRVHRWRYSPTAAYGNNEVHLHPYKARRMSVAETLAIQSLPKAFELPKEIPLSAMFKTIGNGVPYVAAVGIAKTVRRFLEEAIK